MPEDYGILGENKGSGLLPWSRSSDLISKSRNYWVHTTRSDGRPHVKPVWGLWFEEGFYFSTSPDSVTGKNMLTNRSVAVHLESGDDAVILEGTVEQVADRTLQSRLDEAYFAKYAYHLTGNEGGLIYVLRHRTAFAWLERDFVGSATKYNFPP